MPGQLQGEVTQPLGVAKRARVGQREDIRQGAHTAPQGAVEQFMLGGDQFVLPQRILQDQQQLFDRAGLGQKAEDGPLVYRGHGGMLVGVAGEHHPDGMGRPRPRRPQKRHAVHARHVHVRHNDGVAIAAVEGGQSLLRAQRGLNGQLLAQLPLEGRQDVFIVIDEEDFVHGLPARVSLRSASRHSSIRRLSPNGAR